jgi:hypothetical protein
MLVRKPTRQILFILLTAALTLASCNVGSTPAPAVDLDAVSTAAFNTAMAQISGGQTQTALAAPSATVAPTNTTDPATVPGAGTVLPAGDAVLPTVSFNNTPTTPLAGFTPIGSPIAAAPTASLGDACHNSVFIADITIPDGTIFRDENAKGGRPGSEFQKVWRVQNTGTCKWDEGYSLVFVGGNDEMDPHSVKFVNSSQFVGAGETADLGVWLVAPKEPGTYQGTWRMQNDSGSYFGTPLTVIIEVED